jgi:hypothetical protein
MKSGGCGTNGSRATFQILQPRKHHEGLVGAIIGVSPVVGAAGIEETRQQSVGAYFLPIGGLKHTCAMEFGYAGKFVSRQSTKKCECC